ncbi:cwf21-domain-containing protein [Conidiobolus coronatus NRRL 28638]|uniref:Cwf21-domain-containing protein n=1 Tax=Conidiobolus coronatus (strain ATCC 28846 / CBS 209.66 / NRRL 28638) TaxID=796925 RepID=A0A137NU61_CONC2|nr:cwf21-domain-containing protein [Conidiobolus coronatus NRRL 28638]|eukprot:KXN66276.1 cwf21-domain-containing protein [Conidiobolus coronatus NRRL 28638]
MYNGIGLQTARGSGTNGYIQRNKSQLKSRRDPFKESEKRIDEKTSLQKQPDQEILLHERKRKIEIKCMELRLQLEDDGLDEDEIDEKVDVYREELLKKDMDKKVKEDAQKLKEYQTHQLADAKHRENKNL